MAESSYERARRLSDAKVLNQTTGKYERRDENWMPPEGMVQCDYCGAFHPDEHMDYNGPMSDTDERPARACPDCIGNHHPGKTLGI